MPHATINGASLYYEDHGSGPPVILHHGYTGSHTNWEHVVPLLRDRYRVILVDCRGAGDSEHTEDGYSIEQYAADVVGMADYLGLGSFTYVGHSMGGVIGMELGIAHGHRLEKLVLVAPAPADGVAAPPEYQQEAKKAWASKDFGRLLQQRIMLSAQEVDPDLLPRLVERALSVSEKHYDLSWEALVRYNKGDRLQEITTPTLLMAGAGDGLLPANLKDFQRLPNATLHVFSRVSHGIPYEVPRAFTEVLTDFLEHGVVNARTLQARLMAASAAGGD